MAQHAQPALGLVLILACGINSGPGVSAEPATPTPEFRAKVVSVGDGDTLRVSKGGRPITIRLACIDAPETAQSPWGQQSRAYLMQRLPSGREVTIRPHTTDRYGRTVAEVISDININLVMVEDGQAYPLRGPAATPIAATSAAATPRSTSMPNTGPAGTTMGCGRWRAASPARGTSAVVGPAL